MTDIPTLIAEARSPHCKDCDHFMRAMADALEAEHQHREEWANGGVDRWAEYYDRQIEEARNERDHYRAAIEGIAALHFEHENTTHTIPATVCAHRYCVDGMGDQVAWPCPTAKHILAAALDEAEGQD